MMYTGKQIEDVEEMRDGSANYVAENKLLKPGLTYWDVALVDVLTNIVVDLKCPAEPQLEGTQPRSHVQQPMQHREAEVMSTFSVPLRTKSECPQRAACPLARLQEPQQLLEGRQ